MHSISLVCLSAFLAIGSPSQKTVTKSDVATATATVQAIDTANRIITLRSEDGTEDTMYVPTDVTRFDQVKVGDEIPPFVHERVTRTDLVKYAGASGDYNPMHHDESIAQKAGMPSVFAHGMFSMGLLWLRSLSAPSKTDRFLVFTADDARSDIRAVAS